MVSAWAGGYAPRAHLVNQRRGRRAFQAYMSAEREAHESRREGVDQRYSSSTKPAVSRVRRTRKGRVSTGPASVNAVLIDRAL